MTEPSLHYPNLPSLIVDVALHMDEHGDSIVIDNLNKQLLFQWKCTKTGKNWTVQLSKVQRLGMFDDTHPLSSYLRHMISEANCLNKGDGTSAIWQDAMIHDEYIHKMARFKAFW